ncbi:MAG TPA: hypothetical protein VLH86_05680 [Patescibacteria group bacterium]|nr:hypothetical protein [Patescibacteria group bacterium]
MAQHDDIFTGTWYSYHWYPTSDDKAEESSEYRVTAHQKGDKVVFESEPNDVGSYMIMHLSVDGKLATGTWYENTSLKGEYAGMMYSGAGQLIISDDQQDMEGMWAGIGVDHAAGKPRIYTGRWELSRERRSATK